MCCDILDKLQMFGRGGRESSQGRVAVFEAGYEEHLDLELWCFPPGCPLPDRGSSQLLMELRMRGMRLCHHEKSCLCGVSGLEAWQMRGKQIVFWEIGQLVPDGTFQSFRKEWKKRNRSVVPDFSGANVKGPFLKEWLDSSSLERHWNTAWSEQSLWGWWRIAGCLCRKPIEGSRG